MSTIREALADLDFDDEDQLESDELVADAVVLLRLVSMGDGQESVYIATSRNCGAMVQIGMLANALEVSNNADPEATP